MEEAEAAGLLRFVLCVGDAVDLVLPDSQLNACNPYMNYRPHPARTIPNPLTFFLAHSTPARSPTCH